MRPPVLTRRAAIIGASAASAGLPLDPLADLVRRHDEAVAYYNAHAPADDTAADAMADATFNPILARLETDPPRPTTFAGAMAGLAFILHEMEQFSWSGPNEPVLRVCLDYLADREGRS